MPKNFTGMPKSQGFTVYHPHARSQILQKLNEVNNMEFLKIFHAKNGDFCAKTRF